MLKQDLSIPASVNNQPSIPGLLCFWDFGSPEPYLSKGKYAYTLIPSSNKISLINEGPLSGSAVWLNEGEYLFIPRSACPGLNIHGRAAAVTVCAWVKRQPKSFDQCEAIAGIWNETQKKRQYCLFLNISLYDSGDQVCGHISGVGGPTPGNKWCIDVSIGKTKLGYGEWHFVAFSYDGQYIRSWLDGNMDARPALNPFLYQQGIFDGAEDGSDFTVGAVHRLGEMGNDFVGAIGGLAVYDRALDKEEIAALHSWGVKKPL